MIIITTEPTPRLMLDLSHHDAERLQAAQEQGVDIDTLLRQTLNTLPGRVGDRPHPTKFSAPQNGLTFHEIVAPLQEDFQATGWTEEELGEFVDGVVARVRAARRTEHIADTVPVA